MIKIYGKTGCTSCTQAMTYCDVKGVDYEYLSLGKDYEISEFKSIKSGHQSFPLIVSDINGVVSYIGTFQNLKEYLTA